MIRILHTIDTTGPGGAETVFVSLVKGLDRTEFEPIVAICGLGWVCDELKKNGINPIILNSSGSLNFKYLFGIIKIIRENKIDIIQSHLLGANLYCSLAGMMCGVPVVSTFHGFVDVNPKERFSSIKSRIINYGSNRIVFVSELLKKYYVEQMGFAEKKSITIYNGVDTSVFKPQRDDNIRKQLGLGPDNILVGAVGNIRPAKGYEYLLEAARLVIDEHPQFRFVIAGEGSGKIIDDLLSLRKKLGLDEYFYFVGFQADVPKLLNNLDIFVLPSISEGFSISTIEAMACGVPVIVTRSGGPEEIVENETNGCVVPSEDYRVLASAIIEVMEEDIHNEIIKSARDICLAKFSSKSMLTNYLELYSFILTQ